jgi:hypothetical protein
MLFAKATDAMIASFDGDKAKLVNVINGLIR